MKAGTNVVSSDEYRDLRKAIENKEISAISVDTTVFDDSGMRLDKGIFSQLRQFKRHPSSLVISEVVLKEIGRHLLKAIRNKRDRFSRDMIDAAEFVGYAPKEVEEMRAKLIDMPTAEVQCERQLSTFLAESAAITVEADDHINVGDVLACYFDRSPPFHAENPKKNEFPDAIALLSLDGWARDNETEVIVVSRDEDWISFCEKSDNLHHVKELPLALALFQSPDEAVGKMVEDLRAMLNDPTSDVFSRLEYEIRNLEWSEYITFNGDSQFQLDEDDPHVDIEKCYFVDQKDSIVVTDIEEDAISVVFALQVEGEIVVNYEFHKWDGIDREYVHMGSNEVRQDFTISVSVMLQLPTRSADPADMDWEIEPNSQHFEFGELEPDWMSE